MKKMFWAVLACSVGVAPMSIATAQEPAALRGAAVVMAVPAQEAEDAQEEGVEELRPEDRVVHQLVEAVDHEVPAHAVEQDE